MLEKTLRNSEKGWEETVRNITDRRLAKVWFRAKTPISPPIASQQVYRKLLRTKFIQIHFNYLKKYIQSSSFRTGLWNLNRMDYDLRKGRKPYTLWEHLTPWNPIPRTQNLLTIPHSRNLTYQSLSLLSQSSVRSVRLASMIQSMTVRKKPGSCAVPSACALRLPVFFHWLQTIFFCAFISSGNEFSLYSALLFWLWPKSFVQSYSESVKRGVFLKGKKLYFSCLWYQIGVTIR